MSPNWRIDNGRHKLRCGVAQGVVSETLPGFHGKFMWRVDVNGGFGMATNCATADEGKERCEEAIRAIADGIIEGLTKETEK